MSSVPVNDLILYLMARLPGEEMDGVPSHIHAAFAEAAEQFPDLLGDLKFRHEGPLPYSDELGRILFRLNVSGITYVLGPSLRVMLMPTDVKRMIEAEYEHLDGDVPPELLEFLEERLCD